MKCNKNEFETMHPAKKTIFVLLPILKFHYILKLYGASWNPSMPRFAANLGLTPLEPIRTEIPPCAQKSSPSTSSQPSSSDIPSAQFDWNGSGLVNPLDCKYFKFNILLMDYTCKTNIFNRKLKIEILIWIFFCCININ